jgi:hypothetical protein
MKILLTVGNGMLKTDLIEIINCFNYIIISINEMT